MANKQANYDNFYCNQFANLVICSFFYTVQNTPKFAAFLLIYNLMYLYVAILGYQAGREVNMKIWKFFPWYLTDLLLILYQPILHNAYLKLYTISMHVYCWLTSYTPS